MMVVGITGGIGSGKSIVCKVFALLGIPVYDADSEAKLLYEKYPELKSKVKEHFGDAVIDKQGKINKKKLSELIFNDDKKLELLNKLVHPLVKKDFEEWIELHKGFPYLIKEAAILIESGASALCDRIINVSSPLDLRIERLMKRDGKSKSDLEKIMKKQMTDEERNTQSDFIVINDEVQMVIPQVLKIHQAILRLS